MRKALAYGAVAVGAYLLYKHMAEAKAAKDAAAAAVAAQAASLQTEVAAMIPGMGDDYMLLPPSGRTLSAGGQVLGNLGRNEDVLASSPAQYRSAPQNDFNPDGINGWGSVVHSVTHAASQVAAVIKPVVKAISVAAVQVRAVVGKGLIQGGTAIHIIKPSSGGGDSGAQTYVDANGKPISKEEYDRQMAEALKYSPKSADSYKGHTLWTYQQDALSPVVYLVDYDAVKSTAQGIFDTMADAKAAIDSISSTTNTAPATPPAVIAPPVPIYAQTYSGHTVHTLVKSDGGVVYLVDVAPGDLQSSSNFNPSYASLVDAANAINAFVKKQADAAAAKAAADAAAAAAEAAHPTVHFDDVYQKHTISTLKQPSGGVVYLLDAPAGGDGSGFTPYPTKGDALNAINMLVGQGSSAATKTSPPNVAFAKAYGGHAISTLTQYGGGVNYLVDAPQGGISSGSGFTTYPTMAAAQAAIDAVAAPVAAPAATPTAAAAATNTISFAQAYGGHAISTLTLPSGGVAYVIDAPAGSDGSGLVQYQTMAAAQANIDSTNPQPQVSSAPVVSYDSSQNTTALPVSVSSVQTPAPQYTAPYPVPSNIAPVAAPAKSNTGLLVGGGLVAATLATLFLSK